MEIHTCAYLIRDRANSRVWVLIAGCTNIRFCDFVPKNVECPVLDDKNKNSFNTTPYHTIAVLSTASGLEFAFDPTAAQFGWKEHLAPWALYRERRVDLLYYQEVCRPLDPFRTPTRQKPRRSVGFQWKYECAAEGLVENAKACLPDNTLEGGVLDRSEADFEAQRSALRVAQECWVVGWASREGLL